MRLCRFEMDETVLAGFYLDEVIIPLDQAFVADELDEDLAVPPEPTSCLLSYLPHGANYETTRALWDRFRSGEISDGDSLPIPIEDVRLLRPIASPGKILLLAGNYARHVEERGGTAASRSETFPYVFMKPPSTLNDPDGPIVIPSISPGKIDWECELAVVIGARCRKVSERHALNYVAGYTIANDVSDRGFCPNPERRPREKDAFFDWLHGKWHDTFMPMGPCILAAEPDLDPQDLPIQLMVNGRVHQRDSTASMVFPVAAIVSFLSNLMTLEPGDVISTGTPSGVGAASEVHLRPGDRVDATIGRIGTLSNVVVVER